MPIASVLRFVFGKIDNAKNVTLEGCNDVCNINNIIQLELEVIPRNGDIFCLKHRAVAIIGCCSAICYFFMKKVIEFVMVFLSEKLHSKLVALLALPSDFLSRNIWA